MSKRANFLYIFSRVILIAGVFFAIGYYLFVIPSETPPEIAVFSLLSQLGGTILAAGFFFALSFIVDYLHIIAENLKK